VSIQSSQQFQSNAKSPDVPGGLDIATSGANVSPFEARLINYVVIAGLDRAIHPPSFEEGCAGPLREDALRAFSRA
jgi:hypothetical protein